MGRQAAKHRKPRTAAGYKPHPPPWASPPYEREDQPRQKGRAGYVTRFEVESDFLSRYPVQQVGGRTILELWVPAEELDKFNAHIVGEIRLTHEFS
ncbi:hypothetical protein BX281_4027 [Streptomyces sp. Ag82_O1-15]|nr:hypothetical protein BX281_4027 [Streptomyces sp. Ag82_O1-15]